MIEERKVSLDHVLGDVRTENGLVGISSKSSKELKCKIVNGNESVNIAIAEHVHVNTGI